MGAKNFSILYYLLAIYGIYLSNAADVFCNFGTEVPFPSCQSFNITPVTSGNEEILIVGQPADYIDNATSTLSFDSNSIINFIPTKLFKYYTNLRSISAYSVSITTLTENAFNYCDKLEGIFLYENTISHIPARFASTCRFVIYLSLGNNKIKSIDENAFQGLESLSYLSLSNNEITCIPPRLFQYNLGLLSIDFVYNRITALHPITFAGHTQLCSLQFGYNQIGYVPNFDFRRTCTVMSNTIWFSLYNNPIMAIDPQFTTNFFYSRSFAMSEGLNIEFSPENETNKTTCIDKTANPKLQYQVNAFYWVQYNSTLSHYSSCYSNWTPEMASNSMITCGNTLTQTTTFAPSTESPLTTEDPSSNAGICRYYLDWHDRYTCVIKGAEFTLTSITGTHLNGFDNSNVTRVYFYQSELSIVPGILFDTFDNLNFLSIANCGLNIINDKTFNKCGNLEFLDASNNNIIHVQETSLKNCTKLKTIDLTGNPVDYLDTQLYKLDPALEKIHLNRLEGLELA